MNRLRVRLQANLARLAFTHTVAVLREMEPSLHTPEPHWLTIAEALETVEPGGTRPAGFRWTAEATLRPDDGQTPDHLALAQTFVASSPG
jgi:hypothetical protein